MCPRLAALLATLVLGACATVGPDVLARERALLDAVLRHDAPSIDGLLGEDILATGPTGKVLNKSQLLDKWTRKDPGISFEASALLDASVHRYGEAVIVNAIIRDEYRDGAGFHRVDTRVTDVWVRSRGAWRLVAAHESEAAH